MRPSAPLRLALAFLPLSLLAACDDDDGGGPGTGGPAELETLSGKLVRPDGSGLAGATVAFGGAQVLTDPQGLFLLPTSGIQQSGSFPLTVTGPAGFGTLQLPVQVAAGETDIALPLPITVPDLLAFPAGAGTVSVDGSGASLAAIDVEGPLGDLGLAAPAGTGITIDGAPAVNSVDLNIAPLAADALSPGLPGGLLNVGAAAIAPADASFMVAGADGLDLVLPNAEGLALGTVVDIYAYDTETLAWVNQTALTGRTGTVVQLPGGPVAIQALGLVDDGGLYAAVLDADAACATTLAGSLTDGAGAPLAGAAVQTSTGQSAISAADGSFEISGVPAYDPAAGACTPRDLTLEISAPVNLGGATSAPLTVFANQLQPGGVTDLGALDGVVTQVGCIAGQIVGMLAASGAPVVLDGPTATSATPAADGSFFACGLAPGSYTASYTFDGDPGPTTTTFGVEAGDISKIELERVVGGGTGSLEVTVLAPAAGGATATAPIAGAQVFVRGTDAVSVDGLMATSDAAGRAVFQEVDGPFEITAVSESLVGAVVLRRAATLVGVAPAAGAATILLDLDGDPLATAQSADAELRGGLANVPAGCAGEVRVVSRERIGSRPLFEERVLAENNVYSFDVPSGLTLDLSVSLDCGTGAAGTDRLGLSTGVAALAPGELRTLDLDVVGGSFADANQALSLAVNGQAANSFPLLFVDLLASDAGGLDVPIALLSGADSAFGGQLDLPDLFSGPLAGLDTRVAYESNADLAFNDVRQSQRVVQDLASAGTPQSIELLAVPSAPGATTTSAPEGLNLGFSTPAAGAGEGSYDVLSFEGFGFEFEGGEENAIVRWNLYLPAGTTSISLPAAAAEILQPTTYDGRVRAVRLGDAALDYADLYAADATTRVQNARQAASAERTSTRQFELQVNP